MASEFGSDSSGISFLYEFDVGNTLVENFGSNVLRVSSQAVGDFDKGNVTTESTREVWRSADVLTEQEIVLKAELKTQIDTFAILGHNFTEGAVVRIQANIDDVWIAPPFNQVVVVDSETQNIVLANNGFGADYEYYRVTVLDPSNPCGYIEIGRLIGGRAFTFTNDEDISDSYQIGYNDESERMRTQGYFRASNENVTVRTFSANIAKIFTITGNDANFRGFRAMRSYVKTTRPFLVILDRENVETLNMWGQFNDLPNESFGVNQFATMPIKIEEVF